MRSAEEVAKEIIKESRLAEWCGAYVIDFEKSIAQALTAYAEERVEEAIDRIRRNGVGNYELNKARAEGFEEGLKKQLEIQLIREKQDRDEALEEAATCCDENGTGRLDDLIKKIRALKNKK